MTETEIEALLDVIAWDVTFGDDSFKERRGKWDRSFSTLEDIRAYDIDHSVNSATEGITRA